MDLNSAAPLIALALVGLALLWQMIRHRVLPAPSPAPTPAQPDPQPQAAPAPQPIVVQVQAPPPAKDRPLLRDALDAVEEAGKDRFAVEMLEVWTKADARRRRLTAAQDLTDLDEPAPVQSAPVQSAPTQAAPTAAPSSAK